MDLLVKGRGLRITDPVRRVAEHRLAKLERLDPRVSRVEVEITKSNPRIEGGHHVELVASTARRTFRAEASGRDIDSALDQAAHRLERQITRYRGRLRNRSMGRTDGLNSPRTSADA